VGDFGVCYGPFENSHGDVYCSFLALPPRVCRESRPPRKKLFGSQPIWLVITQGLDEIKQHLVGIEHILREETHILAMKAIS
jgi:hypothetical protein